MSKKDKSVAQLLGGFAGDMVNLYIRYKAVDAACKGLTNACHTLLELQEDQKKLAKKNQLIPEVDCSDYVMPTPIYNGKKALRCTLREGVRDIHDIVLYTKKAFWNNGIDVEVVRKTYGPSIAKITVKPLNNIQKAFSKNMDRQLKYTLNCEDIRIIREGAHITVEYPFVNKAAVRFGDYMIDEEYATKSLTMVPIGTSPEGERVYADIAKMPHMLVAGETGSGKSVFLQSIATSLVFRNTPDDLRLFIIDPKRGAEFKNYNKIAMCRVETEVVGALSLLKKIDDEMEARYKILAKNGCKDIATYNKKVGKMPRLVLIIDELADLMTSDLKKEIERHLVRIGQKSRAAGIHMILATQYPVVKVISGQIKANIPCRVALSVSTRVNSQVIIDRPGAEQLTGNGDMLFLDGKDNRIAHRLQAPYIDHIECNNVLYQIIEENQGGEYDE